MKKLIIACFTVLSANSAQAQETGMKLWYDNPMGGIPSIRKRTFRSYGLR